MKFIKTLFLITIISVFAAGCAYDMAYAHDYHVDTYGTIYDNRYRAHYDPYHNYHRNHNRGYIRFGTYNNRSHIELEFGSRHSRSLRDRYDHRHCRIVTREDYDTRLNRHVYRRYRVCR